MNLEIVFEHSHILENGTLEIILKRYTGPRSSGIEMALAYLKWLTCIEPGVADWQVRKF